MSSKKLVDERSEVITMKRTIIAFFLAMTAMLAGAGDLAVFENLGFSPDSRYFMFGQHVLVTNAGQVYAEIALVDVARNEFVPGGWKKVGRNIPMIPNQNSRGALYKLLAESLDVKKRYGIDHMEQGRLLYTRSNGDDSEISEDVEDDSSSVLSFRDFERGREYELTLYQENEGDAESSAASFHIELAVTDSNGAQAEYTVGNPERKRDGVVSYNIVRVWTGPDGKSLVIVVAKESADLSVRYMVETLVLK